MDGWPLRLSALFAAVLALLFGGCGSQPERSASAVALPVAKADPLEEGVSGSNWPGFRGVNTSGISADKQVAVSWGPAVGHRWKTRLPGPGNSSPVIWGERVLLTSAEGAAERPKLVVLCFDRQQGELLWKTTATSAEGSTHDKNGYASASVATDGKQVFAFFGAAGLFALDLEGHELWQRSIGNLDHVWGAASSPVLYEETVIQLYDADSGSFIAAFDKQSGEELWRTPRDSHGSWSTPVLVDAEVDGGARRHELVVNGTGTSDAAGGLVIAYDPANGKELWRAAGTTDIVSPTAIVGAGLVYSTSGRNGPILAIRPGGTGDVTTSHVVWKHHKGGAYVPTGVAYRNRLFTISDGGVANCYDAGNGEPIWEGRLGGAFTASLVAADGRIYATSEQGTTHVFAAGDQFELLAKNELHERCLATPAISRDEIFIRTDEHLYCMGPQSSAATTAQSGAGQSRR